MKTVPSDAWAEGTKIFVKIQRRNPDGSKGTITTPLSRKQCRKAFGHSPRSSFDALRFARRIQRGFVEIDVDWFGETQPKGLFGKKRLSRIKRSRRRWWLLISMENVSFKDMDAKEAIEMKKQILRLGTTENDKKPRVNIKDFKLKDGKVSLDARALDYKDQASAMELEEEIIAILKQENNKDLSVSYGDSEKR